MLELARISGSVTMVIDNTHTYTYGTHTHIDQISYLSITRLHQSYAVAWRKDTRHGSCRKSRSITGTICDSTMIRSGASVKKTSLELYRAPSIQRTNWRMLMSTVKNCATVSYIEDASVDDASGNESSTATSPTTTLEA